MRPGAEQSNSRMRRMPHSYVFATRYARLTTTSPMRGGVGHGLRQNHVIPIAIVGHFKKCPQSARFRQSEAAGSRRTCSTVVCFLQASAGLPSSHAFTGRGGPAQQRNDPSKFKKRTPNGEAFLRRPSSTSCAGMQRNCLPQARSIMKSARERSRARVATFPCSPLQQSSTAARAGPVFTGRSRARLKPKKIAPFS